MTPKEKSILAIAERCGIRLVEDALDGHITALIRFYDAVYRKAFLECDEYLKDMNDAA